MSDILELYNFSIHRNDITLFEPVSLTIERGQAYELRGKNGIGKTSLLETLSGLNTSFKGDFTLNQPYLYISQHPPFNQEETLLENLSFWAAFWNYPESLHQALTTWGLKTLSHLPHKHLSQGQQQRANLARLSLKPAPLWLLDEPTAALDQDSITVFQSALESHLQQGGGALIATHHPLDLTQQIILKAPKIDSSASPLKAVA
ncbi:MAG TPA: heme ABC exporter ATP-binding protein CcmA [Holosporales bacterium]|nr:heme ABC exporter ATP-binding protein CcmA [Holosporales bacterium]